MSLLALRVVCTKLRIAIESQSRQFNAQISQGFFRSELEIQGSRTQILWAAGLLDRRTFYRAVMIVEEAIATQRSLSSAMNLNRY